MVWRQALYDSVRGITIGDCRIGLSASIMTVVGSFSAAFLLVSYFKDYFTQIGIRYLAIPAMSISVGTALENKK